MKSLTAIRQSLNLKQKDMADKMGLPLRTYQDIETGKTSYRPIHQKLADYIHQELTGHKPESTAIHITGLPEDPEHYMICSEMERIASLIGDGFTSGEILTTDTNGDLHRGWWRMFKE